MDTNDIESLMVIRGLDDTDLDDVRNNLEYFIPLLKQAEDTKTLDITDVLLDRFQFDFTGLMLHLAIPYRLHWISMRMSGLTAVTELDKRTSQVLIPSGETVTRLINTYNSNKRQKR